MKILIENCFSHRYLKSVSEWTDDPNEARAFPTSERALAYCTEHHIPEVQVVLKFEYDQYDIRVPVSKECQKAAESTA